jgi:hypothetical protein
VLRGSGIGKRNQHVPHGASLAHKGKARKEMASTREKGKIPHTEWPKILAKYNGGETMAQIGRDYGCTAPAIRYIIKRSGKLKGGADGERLSTVSKGVSSERASRIEEAFEAGGSVRPAGSGQLVIGRAARVTGKHVLGSELRTRVSSDVASFLVALDQAVIEGSTESIANLQDATDRLMRSTARTRLELERLLSGLATAAEEGGHKKVATRPQRNA